MVAWHEFEAEAPEFAARVRARFEANRHQTMATLRRDGSPRISGTELTFEAGEAWLGGGTASMKVRDLLRDPRVAVHGAPLDLEMVEGDAKLAGRAIEERDEAVLDRASGDGERPDNATFFRLDLEEAVLTRVVNQERLEIELWRPGEGVRILVGA
jgi:hypothetical protein